MIFFFIFRFASLNSRWSADCPRWGTSKLIIRQEWLKWFESARLNSLKAQMRRMFASHSLFLHLNKLVWWHFKVEYPEQFTASATWVLETACVFLLQGKKQTVFCSFALLIHLWLVGGKINCVHKPFAIGVQAHVHRIPFSPLSLYATPISALPSGLMYNFKNASLAMHDRKFS